MEKLYNRIYWENEPSKKTPLGKSKLDIGDKFNDDIDNRVIELDSKKFDTSEALTMVANWDMSLTTGVITVTLKNGTVKTFDTALEKVPISGIVDAEQQKLIFTNSDGSKTEVDLKDLITQYEFADSETISFVISAEGKVSCSVKDGSITENKLQPNYLADIKVEVSTAKSHADEAIAYATKAETHANESKAYSDTSKGWSDTAKAWAVGDELLGTLMNNAKYWSEESKRWADQAENIVGMKPVDYIRKGEMNPITSNAVTSQYELVTGVSFPFYCLDNTKPQRVTLTGYSYYDGERNLDSPPIMYTSGDEEDFDIFCYGDNFFTGEMRNGAFDENGNFNSSGNGIYSEFAQNVKVGIPITFALDCTATPTIKFVYSDINSNVISTKQGTGKMFTDTPSDSRIAMLNIRVDGVTVGTSSNYRLGYGTTSPKDAISNTSIGLREFKPLYGTKTYGDEYIFNGYQYRIARKYGRSYWKDLTYTRMTGHDKTNTYAFEVTGLPSLIMPINYGGMEFLGGCFQYYENSVLINGDFEGVTQYGENNKFVVRINKSRVGNGTDAEVKAFFNVAPRNFESVFYPLLTPTYEDVPVNDNKSLINFKPFKNGLNTMYVNNVFPVTVTMKTPVTDVAYDVEETSELLDNRLNPQIKFTFNTRGWVRIAEYVTNVPNLISKGSTANSVNVIIKRGYNSFPSESLDFTLCSTFEKSEILINHHISTNKAIRRIRHMRGVAENKAYIDVYYDADSSNNSFIELSNTDDTLGKWKLIPTPYMVSDVNSNEIAYSYVDLYVAFQGNLYVNQFFPPIEGYEYPPDLNTLKGGTRFFAFVPDTLNTPMAWHGMGMQIAFHNNYAYSTQIVWITNQNETTTKDRPMYIRHSYNGIWTDWYSYSDSKIVIRSGEYIVNKYSDGRLVIEWERTLGTGVVCNNSIGGVYYAVFGVATSFPVSFVGVPTVTAIAITHLTQSAPFVHLAVDDVRKDKFERALIYANDMSTLPVGDKLYARFEGRWK